MGPKISASFFDATGSYVMGYIGPPIPVALAIVLVLVAKILQKKHELSLKRHLIVSFFHTLFISSIA